MIWGYRSENLWDTGELKSLTSLVVSLEMVSKYEKSRAHSISTLVRDTEVNIKKS